MEAHFGFLRTKQKFCLVLKDTKRGRIFMKINFNNLSTKTYICLMIVIILLGGVVVIVPRLVSDKLDKKEEAKISKIEEKNIKQMELIESTEETIEEEEGIEFEPELYSETQMFFDNIDVLYNSFSFNDVELIKEKVEIYVSRYVDDVRDCKVLDGVTENEEMFSFEIQLSNQDIMEIQVKKEDTINPLDKVAILHKLD